MASSGEPRSAGPYRRWGKCLNRPVESASRRAAPASAPGLPVEPAVARADVRRLRPERAWILAPVGLGTIATLLFGWSVREERYLVPDEGLGYALGVAGLAMMLLLLLYVPLKRIRALHRFGRIPRWLAVHMCLGILGPAAILFHANFRLGSLNANVALLCMLVVSGSGIVGRFLYTRVHYAYLGRVATLEELRGDARREGRVLAAAIAAVPEMGRVLGDFRESALVRRPSWPGRVAAFLTLGHRARAARRRALHSWRRHAGARASAPGQPTTREVRRALAEQLRAIRRVAEYATWERGFALWHALHLPFCVGLFVAAAVHVVAVHMY